MKKRFDWFDMTCLAVICFFAGGLTYLRLLRLAGELP
jgi:hypothetical protein